MKNRRRPAFNPEGSGYDVDGALTNGLRRDATGHFPSRVPSSGLLLKGRKHPTWNLLEEGERKAGYSIKKRRDGRYESSPRGLRQ